MKPKKSKLLKVFFESRFIPDLTHAYVNISVAHKRKIFLWHMKDTSQIMWNCESHNDSVNCRGNLVWLSNFSSSSNHKSHYNLCRLRIPRLRAHAYMCNIVHVLLVVCDYQHKDGAVRSSKKLKKNHWHKILNSDQKLAQNLLLFLDWQGFGDDDLTCLHIGLHVALIHGKLQS